MLGAYLVALYAIPGDLIVRPLGAAGTPAQIIGIGLIAWWLTASLLIPPSHGPAPAAWPLLLFACAILTSYVVGMSRPILSGIEANSSDRALLSLAAWCGVALVFTDGVGTPDRLERLLKGVAVAGVIIALLGMLQFFFAIDLARIIRIPGLSANGAIGQLFDRSGYRRVSATTSHPIEFGVVLAAILPLAIHNARFAPSLMAARRWWIGVGVIAVALPMSVARSAILGGAIAFIILFPTWPTALKRRSIIAGVAGAIGMSALVPGLLGTIKSLFLNAGSDPSAQGRTADYAPVLEYVRESPLFGRGVGTFIPDLYRTLDNQYLGTLVEAGVVGLAATLGLLGATAGQCLRVRHRTTKPEIRDLALSLLAGVTVIAVNAATFDAFAFPVCVGTLFVLIGAASCMYRIHLGDEVIDSHGSHRAEGTFSRLTLAGLAMSLVLALCVLGAAYSIVRAEPRHRVQATVLLSPPGSVGQPPYARAGRASTLTSVMHDVLDSDTTRSHVAIPPGASFEVAVGDGSLMRGTDDIGFGPTLSFAVEAKSAAEASRTLTVVLNTSRAQLADLQSVAGVPQSEQVQQQLVRQIGPYSIHGRPSRALLGIAIMAGLVFGVASRVRERSLPLRTGSLVSN